MAFVAHMHAAINAHRHTDVPTPVALCRRREIRATIRLCDGTRIAARAVVT